jgi:hypothetical protein
MKVEELRSLLFSFEDQNSDHIIDFNEEVNIESNESERDRETVEKGGEEKGEDIIHQEPIEAFASIHREDKINKYYLNISGSSQAIHIDGNLMLAGPGDKFKFKFNPDPQFWVECDN